nr:uncharacterized protein LOC105848696 [Hydra vulgaris]
MYSFIDMEVKDFVTFGIGLVIGLVSFFYYSYFEKKTTEQKEFQHYLDKKHEVPIEDKTFCPEMYSEEKLQVILCLAKKNKVSIEDKTFCLDMYSEEKSQEIQHCLTEKDKFPIEDITFCDAMYSEEKSQEIKHCLPEKHKFPNENKTFRHVNNPVQDNLELGNNQLSDKNWKSVFDDLSDEDKIRFYEKTILPFKNYREGLSRLIKNLDQNERFNDIVDYLELHENDRVKILLALYGGGNPAKSLFEKLEQYKPDLKIKDLCKCLKTFCLNSALECLESFKYSDEEKVSNINKIHLTSFSYKLISFNANDQPWKDVAFELLGSKEDVNRIAKTIMHQNAYSPTEKLIDILSSQRSTTIQEFINVLKDCKVLDAHELICQQIIAKIKEEKI